MNLEVGHGVFFLAAHGSCDQFRGWAVEVFPYTEEGWDALQDSLDQRVADGWDPDVDIFTSDIPDHDFHIGMYPLAVGVRFVTSETVVYDASCCSYDRRSMWVGARDVLCYAGSDSMDLVEEDSELFWNCMNGEHEEGKDARAIERAYELASQERPGGTFRHVGSGNTVLAPTVADYEPTEYWLYYEDDVPGIAFQGRITFDCKMSYFDPACVLEDSLCEVTNAELVSDHEIEFVIQPTSEGKGYVKVAGLLVSSHGNGAYLDGNQDPQNSDGMGPNRDDWKNYYSFRDNDPAALLDWIRLEDGQLVWHVAREKNTLGYRVLGSDDPEGDHWELIGQEIPARGGGEYRAHLPAWCRSIRLQEKEQISIGVAWVDLQSGSITALSIGGGDGKRDRPYNRRPVRLLGPGDALEEMHAFVEQAAAAGVHVELEIVPSLAPEDVQPLVAERRQQGLIPVLWSKRHSCLPGKVRGSPATVTTVYLVAGDELGYENVLPSYGFWLETFWNQGSITVEDVYIPPPYGFSQTKALIDSLKQTADYIILFGQPCQWNESQGSCTVTMPACYLSDPDSQFAYYTDNILTLWDYERSEVDTCAVGIPVGLVPVRDLNDLWRYHDKMLLSQWNRQHTPPPDYGDRLGIWAYDETYAPDLPGHVARYYMEEIVGEVGPGWEKHELWSSTFDYPFSSCAARNDSACAALNDGRDVVAILSTASNPRRLGFWLQDRPGWCCPLDVDSVLAESDTYAQLLAMSCSCAAVDLMAHGDGGPAIATDVLFVDRGGAIACIGPTRAFPQYHYYRYLRRFMELYEVPDGGEETLGRRHLQVRNALLEEYATDPLMPLFCKMTILLGDPTIRIGGPRSAAYQWVEDSSDAQVPVRYALSAVTPNPFNPATVIEFSVPERAHVSLRIYDVQGRVVRTLLDGTVDAGIHHVIWEGRNSKGMEVASGVYFCRLKADDHEAAAKLVLLR